MGGMRAIMPNNNGCASSLGTSGEQGAGKDVDLFVLSQRSTPLSVREGQRLSAEAPDWCHPQEVRVVLGNRPQGVGNVLQRELGARALRVRLPQTYEASRYETPLHGPRAPRTKGAVLCH